jgi:hypothetical protein
MRALAWADLARRKRLHGRMTLRLGRGQQFIFSICPGVMTRPRCASRMVTVGDKGGIWFSSFRCRRGATNDQNYSVLVPLERLCAQASYARDSANDWKTSRQTQKRRSCKREETASKTSHFLDWTATGRGGEDAGSCQYGYGEEALRSLG